MILLSLLSIGGLLAGLLLLRRVPVVPARPPAHACELRVSIVIPARNEEANLPPLLESLRNSPNGPLQILVVDDASTDNTAAVAADYGATVIASAALPQGWTGKTWACHQGSLTATGDALLFLDADTRFADDGYARIVDYFAGLPQGAALSILPYHRTRCWCEELSLFFNILVAMGAGGFGGLDAPHLFGQALLIRRDIYARSGGHERVKHEILENLHLAAHVHAAGGHVATLGGRGTLEMRMFPSGFAQMRESWQKAFVNGAGATSPLVLSLSIWWLSGAMLTALMLCVVHGPLRWAGAALYLLNVIQIAWYARQLGTFRQLSALFYPLPLAFYFVTFAQSALRRRRGAAVTWKGREL
jgi:4,4'-diaponeurosporenoate glycosyltransferase